MSAKNSAKTSKTAHVMNLLSKGRPAGAAEGEEQEAPAAAARAGEEYKPLADMVDTDQAISDQIKDALEKEAREELGDAPAPPEPAAPQAPEAEAPAPEPAAPQTPEAEAPAPEPAAPQTPVAEAPAPEAVTPAAAETPASAAPRSEAPEPAAPKAAAPQVPEPREPATVAPVPDTKQIECVNVMEVLVDEKADRYIKMFGLCQCQRCVVDVKALTLSNLPPKYVVMGKGEMVPRITIYESRYSTAITAQIMRACKIVMENPRHDM